jgi:hypothetical protein
MNRLCFRILILAGAIAGPLMPAEPSRILIRGARVVTGNGAPLAKANVLIKDGLIEAVGGEVAIPPDAWILEAEDLTVYPGLIDALSTVGLDNTPRLGGPQPTPPTPPITTTPARGPDDRPRTTSWELAGDRFRATDAGVATARNAGFTSAIIFPNQGIFAGQGSVVNLGGESIRRVIVEPAAGQMITLSAGGRGGGRAFPSSLMGVYAYIRQTYLDMAHYKQSKEIYARDPRGKVRPVYDRALEGLMDSQRVLFPAVSRREIERALEFLKEIPTPAVLYGAHAGYAASARIKQSNLPVVISLKWPTRPVDANPDDPETLESLTLRDQAPSTPAALAAAQVKFAFSTDGLAPSDALQALRKSLERGLTEDQALRALTLGAAEIFGVADRLGSIERGKIANLVVTRGSLFAERPQVQFVFVDGVKYVPPPAPAAARAPEATR